ncbi:GNAT family N-acetyltransferase [Streptomyces meridianus]|uniref:N-acetyltransferase n=1 Tax=Streptomyces meridianus TaxID=2938945 RepID=A0ABT0X816_9ACTN|nr:N-acetyltransferase [Streptomyces meridianus]MCM2577924.1 N-acetyltransferase [Streptomyces meridianus]
MLIRRETPADIPSVHAVIAAAFAAPDVPEPDEAALVGRLRGSGAWLPELSLVAVGERGQLVGHVLCTRGHVDDVPALGLAPLAVSPGHQGRGTGGALVHAVLGAADALGEPLVAVLGSPAYYGRFDFRPSAEAGVAPPDPRWAAHFQVRTLTGHAPAIRGTFRYAPPFDGL